MDNFHVGVLLYPEFEVLDMAGPIEVLNCLTIYLGKRLNLSVIAATKEPVSPGQPSTFAGQQLYLPTHSFDDAPPLGLLLVPGGPGMADKEKMRQTTDFIRRVYDGTAAVPPVKFVFSVCAGAVLLAWAGVLKDRRATSNKMHWGFVTATSTQIHWIAKARWVVDDRIWTTSGVTAGIDGMLALVAATYGEEVAHSVTAIMEHNRSKDSDDDPWAEVYGCQDVLAHA